MSSRICPLLFSTPFPGGGAGWGWSWPSVFRPWCPALCGAPALDKPALWPPSKARVSLASGAPCTPHASSSRSEALVEQSRLRLQGAQEFSSGEPGPDWLIFRGSQQVGDSRGPRRAEIHRHVSSGLCGGSCQSFGGELREMAAGITPSSGLPRWHSGCQGPALTFKRKLTAAVSCPQRPLPSTWRSIWFQTGTQGSQPTSNFLSMSTGPRPEAHHMVGSQPWVLISVSPAVPGSSQSARSCRTAWSPEPKAPGPAATQVTQPGPCRVSLHQPGSKSRWSWPSPGSELKAQGALPTHTFNSPTLDHRHQARERPIPMGSS